MPMGHAAAAIQSIRQVTLLTGLYESTIKE
jgi:hypothetical protein